jgi:phage terminase small subunit
MNNRQKRFVAEYLKDLNATQAAIRAGYSRRSAYMHGERLMRNDEVSCAITEAQKRLLNECELDAKVTLEQLARIAFCDARCFFDEAGNLKPLSELTPEQGSTLASFEVIKKNAEAGDGTVYTVYKIKLWDKIRALEMLAKYFGLLQEKVDHAGEVAFRWLDSPDARV